MLETQAIDTQRRDVARGRPVPARSALPWRLLAVVAVGMQIISAICGVLLLFYWIAASIALIE